MSRILFLVAALGAAMPACTPSSEARAAVPHALWVCPMHHGFTSDKPGACGICGMALVPAGAIGGAAVPTAEADRDRGHDHAQGAAQPAATGLAPIVVDAERRRLIGLRTAEVRRQPLGASLRTTGRITFDETRVYKVQPRFDGFIETLTAGATGTFVAKGARMASIYSPDLLATQQEYLLARKARGVLAGSGLADASESARARLRLWGMTSSQLASLEARGEPLRTVDVVAPASGWITTRNAVVGARVTPEQPLFEIIDLSRVWVIADVYEHDLPRVRVGQAAAITLGYWPDRTWTGRVDYVLPTVDDKTRTVKVRIAVDNKKLELKPEMFADVVLDAKAREALVVPEDAVIESGTRKVVFLSLADGRLEPREVRTGDASAGLVEVREGLVAGDVVALGANFLVDSESRLKAALSAMGAAPAVGAAP